MPGYLLNPTLPVLLRPDGAVQVGWDPRRAVLVEPPAGLTATTLANLLRGMQSGTTVDDLTAQADTPALADLLANLIEAGVVTPERPRAHRTPSVRIHGRGPLSDLLVAGLRCSGARVGHTRAPKASAPPEATDLVILADYLIAEPRLLRDLHKARVPHLAVRTRDGSGLVGPLVLPGRTSCLACADLHRSDRDAAWPAVAAQLRGTVGNADRATVLATAALALEQVERLLRAIRESGAIGVAGEPAPAVDTTYEFDVATRTTTIRRWSHHPRCECWT
ncbi:cyclodehydratase [Mycobacterium sp. 852013-51886_SCH5428379]|uniref:cyclodehydratase n=1 Tax=Mycobacterium sp. 852013-51886_SCH5428379 TaxID=1834111 RepID=UPI0008019C66|nr:cyclodehydratase [Mycobacterium sp. 852013-51886_SCH5428379]OBB60947.1 cyclodehydratase [Mycobacterium sp. 852013-51886_SCH5428379]